YFRRTKMRKLIAGFILAIIPVVPAGAATCVSLAVLKLPETGITSAQEVAAGKVLPPDEETSDQQSAADRALPAFCRVHGVIQPSADSHIEFEVWLPLSGWNGRYMGVGNGGSGGFINYSSNVHSLSSALRDGFSASSTDTGHRGSNDDFSFARGHREKRI